MKTERKTRSGSRDYHTQKAILILLIGILVSSIGIFAQTRPRPVLSGNTILTGDTLQPLRGVRWALDTYPIDPPTLTELMEMREHGCNALHVYAEQIQICELPSVGCVTAGCNQTRLQTLVERTRQAGLYMVITVGGGNPGHVIDPDCDETADGIRAKFEAFNLAFWNHYAPLFADDTHLIFEIQNEPYFSIDFLPQGPVGFAQPTLDWVIDLNAKAYQIIATKAPHTPVLLFSYGFLHDAMGVRTDMNRFEAAVAALPPLPKVGPTSLISQSLTVNWGKVAVAFHGYALEGMPPSTPIDTLTELIAGPPIQLIETEADTIGNLGINFDNILGYEHFGISWLSFREPWAPNHHSWYTEFRDILSDPTTSEGGLIWVPDYGTWPAVSDPPIGATISLDFEARGFVRVDATSGQLIADAAEVSTATNIIVKPGTNGGILLQSALNGKYVTLAGSSSDEGSEVQILQASATSGAMAEEFLWLTRESDGRIALQATTNQNYVTADLDLQDPPSLRANRWRGGGPWSGFVLEVQGPPPGQVPNFIGRIDGQDIEGLVIDSSSPQIDFSWNHASSEVGIDHYQITLKEVGAPVSLYDETVNYPGRTLSLQTSGLGNDRSYSIQIKAWDGQGQNGPFVSGGSFTVELAPSVQEPFRGVPFTIAPDRITVIQAEDFDLGGEGVAVHDTTPGNVAGQYRTQTGQDVDIVKTDNRYHLGFTDPDEWTEYTVQITGGIYDIEIWTATTFQGRRFFLELYNEFKVLLGSTESMSSIAPNTGDWGHFQKVVISNVNLSGAMASSRFLRLVHQDGLINVDRITIRPKVTHLTGDAFAGHSTGAMLNGTPSDNGAKVWASHFGAVFAAPGWITNASSAQPYGFVPFHPSEAGSKAVVIEADFNIDTSNQNDWLSLGFQTSPGSIWSGNGEIWLLVRRDGRYTVFALRTTYTLATGQISLSAMEKAAPKRAVLKYEPNSDKVSAWINGMNILDDVPLPAGFTPVINYAGFTAHGATLMPHQIFVDNFDINLE